MSGAAASCSVPLLSGQNTIVLAAVDVAGNSSSVGVRATRTAPPTAITIAPTTVAVAVGDTRGLTAVSDTALPVAGVVWSSSDASVVSIDPANDGTIVAESLGQATVTATLGGLTATATVRVLPGAVQPGEAIWTSAPPSPGRYLQAPMRANPVLDDDPDLFSVEADPAGSNMLVTAVRGADGAPLWSEAVAERPQAADAFGGFLERSIIAASPFSVGVLRRIGGGGVAPWTYVSPGGIGSAAAGPDGTVYVTENVVSPSAQVLPNSYRVDSFLVGLDGRTGAVRFRRALPNGTARWPQETEGGDCVSPLYYDGGTLGPITILENGDAAVQQAVQHVTHSGGCPAWSGSGPLSRQVTLSVWRVSPAGAITSTMLHDHSGTWPLAGQRIGDEEIFPAVNRPDGHGGILSTWQTVTTVADGNHPWEGFVTRVAGGSVAFEQPAPWAKYWDGRERQDVMVASDGTIYVPGGPNGELQARDAETWALRWTATGNGDPVTALDDGGAVVLSDGALQTYGSDGTLASSDPTSLVNALTTASDEVAYGLNGATGALEQVEVRKRRRSIWSFLLGGPTGCTPFALYRDQPLADRPGTHIGLVPNAQYTFDTIDTAGSFQAWQVAGVRDGFKEWNDTSAEESLNRTFRIRSDGERQQNVLPSVAVRKTDLGSDSNGQPYYGALLPPANHPGDQRITTATLWLTTDDKYLWSAEGHKLITMHEVGHALGLAHPTVFRKEGTVMNTPRRYNSQSNLLQTRDDFNRVMARRPTTCDVEGVRATQTP